MQKTSRQLFKWRKTRKPYHDRMCGRVSLVVICICVLGCQATQRPLAKLKHSSSSLVTDRKGLGPFDHPINMKEEEIHNLLTKVWYQYKGPTLMPKGPYAFFRPTEAPLVETLLLKGLAQAGPQDRVRIRFRHDHSSSLVRDSSIDFFVKDGALHLLFQKMLVARSAMGDAINTSHMYPKISPREAQTLMAEPGQRLRGRKHQLAPDQNWLSIPRSQGDTSAVRNRSVEAFKGNLAALRKALNEGAISQELYENKVAELKEEKKDILESKRRSLKNLLDRKVLTLDEYEDALERLEGPAPR